MPSKPIPVPAENVTQYMLNEISSLWAEMSYAAGRIAGFSHVLDAVVVSHPQPEALQKLLSDTRADLIDEIIDGETDDLTKLKHRDGWMRTLKHFDELVAAVVASRAQEE